MFSALCHKILIILGDKSVFPWNLISMQILHGLQADCKVCIRWGIRWWLLYWTYVWITTSVILGSRRFCSTEGKGGVQM